MSDLRRVLGGGRHADCGRPQPRPTAPRPGSEPGRGRGGHGRRGRKGSVRGMRICIVGCGAVGSLFAANLARLDDVEVWAYDLAQDHVDAINRHGLRLSGAGEVVGRPRATSDAAALPRCEFGIVATKAMHTEAAIAATAHAFVDGCVATVQNGLGNEETIAVHVARVIRGTTFPAGKLLAPGHVQWDVRGDTTLGPFEPQPAPLEEVARLADACTRAGMPTQAVTDARGPQWRKVIFNAATNPVGALTRLTHGRVCERPELRSLVSALVDEGKAVAAARDGLDAVLVCGNEYTGFEGAVTYLSGFVIVHRYAYVLLPVEDDPVIVFPSEARYVGEHATTWIGRQEFVDRPGEWLAAHL